MATSLAQQLQRLKTPQTSLLVDRNKRASILFDPHEAAKKDRDTIYDIGLSGLHELIAINPNFAQFEATLFERTAKDLERSVATKEVNRLIAKTIKRFLIQLTPFFMLQSCHKCVEWLLRRFNSHLFDRDSLMAMIMPYHETRMFVKCLQAFELSDLQDKWHWLAAVQSPGITLNKQTLFNRAASDPFFFEFICKSTMDSVKEMGLRASMLQAQFAFFCTTIIGALQYKVTEQQVSTLFVTLLKGLSSDAIDFCAASLMILAQLITTTQISQKTLDNITAKLSTIAHPSLYSNVVMIFALIHQHQQEFKQICTDAFDKLIVCTWIPFEISQAGTKGINTMPFLTTLLSKCFHNILIKENDWKLCRKFAESILTEMTVQSEDATQIIQCVLDSYVTTDDVASGDGGEIVTIDLDSDDDMGDETMYDIECTQWYSNYLKQLERQFPAEFDKIVADTIRGKEAASVKRRKSFKIILSFLFKVACSEKDANIFENIYHHSSQHRAAAVRSLAETLSNTSVTPESKDLLKEILSERLLDDDPDVVKEVLKIKVDQLEEVLGKKLLINQLTLVLQCGNNSSPKWNSVMESVATLLTSEFLWQDVCIEDILLATFNYFFPSSIGNTKLLMIVLRSPMANKNKVLVNLKTKVERLNSNEDIENVVIDHLKKSEVIVDVSKLLQILNKQYDDKKLSNEGLFNALWLLSYSLRKSDATEIGLSVLELVSKIVANPKIHLVNVDLKEAHSSVKSNQIPIQLLVGCVETITKDIKMCSIFNSSGLINPATPEFALTDKIFCFLITNMFKSNQNDQPIYREELTNFLTKVVPSFNNKMELFTYYIMPESSNIECLEFKIRTIRLFNIILNNASAETTKKQQLSVTPVQIGRISIGLTNKVAVVRKCLFETLEVLQKIISPQEHYCIYLTHLMQRREEILLDPEQLPLILFTLLNTKKKVFTEVLEEFMKCIESSQLSIEFKGKLLNLLKHINSNEILKRVSKYSLEILRTYKEGDSVIVNPSHSLIYKNAVLKFDQNTIKILGSSSSEAAACFDMIVKSMRQHCLLMQIDNKLVSPAVLVFEQFEEDVFSSLPELLKNHFITEVIKTATQSSDPAVISTAGKLFKKLDLNIPNFLSILISMKRCIVEKSPSEVINAEEWKCGVTLLELFQIKKKISDSHQVIPVLFDILDKSLAAEEQSPFEYTKQLILSCILQCSQKSPTNQLPKSVYRVDLIIQCIRASPNPQTHHHALLLLSKMATIVPEQVLLNVVSIFTFVGSSVVHHDDAYSFQIITNIIETIIPQLVQSKDDTSSQDLLVIQVLKVFAGTILDVPEHRRLPVFVKLLTSLDPSKYLWQFLVILFEMHIMADSEKGDKNKKRLKDEEQQPPRIEVALALVREFEPAIAIETCTALLDYMRELFKDKDDDSMEVDKVEKEMFNADVHTTKQLRHFKYVILLFINNLTQSIQFVRKIISLNNVEEEKKMKPLYKNLIISILFFIPECSKAAEKTTDVSNAKYWKAMIHHCYDILDNSISLLSPEMLLAVVHNLMRNKIALVRRKVIELVNNKLQHDPDYFNECDQANMIELLDPLTEMINTVLSEEKIVENITPNDQIILQQSSLITIKLLSKKLSENYKSHFKDLLDLNTKILKNHTKVHRTIVAAVVLCLSEICAHLKAESLVYLSKFMPSLVKIIELQCENLITDGVLLGLMTALHKIIETLPLFLSPYLVRIVRYLSEIWRKLLAEQQTESNTKCGSILNKLTAIWQKLATVLPLRVLIPTIDQSYTALTHSKEYLAVCPLMDLMIESLKRVDSAEISSLQADVVNLFMNALQLRENTTINNGAVAVVSDDEIAPVDIDLVEGKIISAFVVMVLKLSESSFRVLFYKIRGWALDDPSHKERAITFYRLSSEVADALKSLFVLFAASFIENTATILNECNSLHCSDDSKALYFEDSNKCGSLLKYMLKTLYCVFLHNTQNFMNSHRVDILMQPIVDQLENEIVLQNEELSDLLISTIAQLAVAVSDDIVWKQLNYQILLKTRNNSAEIRLIGLKATIGVARKIGEEFLPLLPETIPFLSELLEDENQEVERACQKAVNELEKILGEPLQKYF